MFTAMLLAETKKSNDMEKAKQLSEYTLEWRERVLTSSHLQERSSVRVCACASFCGIPTAASQSYI